MRCLENNPTDRFTSTLDLLYAFDQAVTASTLENEPGDEQTETGNPVVLNDNYLPSRDRFSVSKHSSRSGGGKILTLLPASYKQPGMPSAPIQPVTLEPALRHNKRLIPGFITGTAVIILAIAGVYAFRPVTAHLPGASAATVVAAGAKISPAAFASVTAATVVLPSPVVTKTATARSASTATKPTPSLAPEPTATGGSSQVAFASDPGGSVQIWIMDGNGDNRRRVTDIEGGACQLAFHK